MKKLLSIVILSLLFSCGTKFKTEQEAIEFLESNSFYDERAEITGQSGGKLKSGFTIDFKNGKAKIGEENLPYTIEEISDGMPNFSGKGFKLKICGSQRYAYGGCIEGYLSSGQPTNGGNGDISLQLKGSNLKAFFNAGYGIKKS